VNKLGIVSVPGGGNKRVFNVGIIRGIFGVINPGIIPIIKRNKYVEYSG
jgi:hypothetical protein